MLFDLGNTLAAYYRTDEFLPVLNTAIARVLNELESLGLARVSFDAACASAVAQNEEAPDFRFVPMAGRFERIFGIPLAQDAALAHKLCELFLEPIFALGRVYADSMPAIGQLRGAGCPVGIVSNAPWGSPPDLWREELGRLGLLSAVDCVVLCGDVGWRKPAPEIFEFAACTLDRRSDECIFVGDDLRWDILGSQAAGMRAILIDRDGRHPAYAGERVADLHALAAVVE